MGYSLLRHLLNRFGSSLDVQVQVGEERTTCKCTRVCGSGLEESKRKGICESEGQCVLCMFRRERKTLTERMSIRSLAVSRACSVVG